MEEGRRKSRAAKRLDSDLETAGSNHGSNNGPPVLRCSTSSDSAVIQCQRLLLLQKREKKKTKKYSVLKKWARQKHLFFFFLFFFFFFCLKSIHISNIRLTLSLSCEQHVSARCTNKNLCLKKKKAEEGLWQTCQTNPPNFTLH